MFDNIAINQYFKNSEVLFFTAKCVNNIKFNINKTYFTVFFHQFFLNSIYTIFTTFRLVFILKTHLMKYVFKKHFYMFGTFLVKFLSK